MVAHTGVNFYLSSFELPIQLVVGTDEETLHTKFQPDRILFRSPAMGLKFWKMTDFSKLQGHGSRFKYLIGLKLHIYSFLISTKYQLNWQFEIR